MKSWLALLSCAVASALVVAEDRVAVSQEPLTVVAPGELPNGLPATPGRLDLPEVIVPEREAVLERGPSPLYHRVASDPVVAWSRLGIGIHVGLPTEQEDTFARATEGAAFSLDVLGGVEITLDRLSPASIVAELGYSYVYEDTHWFIAGFGPGLHRLGPSEDPENPRPTGWFGAALVPHVIVGSQEGHAAYGMRSSLLLRWSAIGVELAHQFARIDDLDRTVHELHLMFSPTFSGVDL